MKKLLLTAFVAFVGIVSANAQINQGAILVGANSNLNFSSISPDGGDSYSSFNLEGKVGYFFVENLAAGLLLDYNKEDEFSQIGFGLFGRYYVNGNIILGANFTTNKWDFGGSDASATGLGLEGGYAAFITDNIAIEPTLNLNLYSGDIDQTVFGLNVGFSLYLGRE
jgi:hypothetical protein